MKKCSIKGLDSERLVCMAALCYSGPISAVSTNEQLLGEKGCKVSNRYLENWETSAHIYRQTDMAKSTQFVILTIYTYGYIYTL